MEERTVLASLVLIVSKSTVESGKFSQLVSLELVLTFGDGCCRLDDVVNQFFGLIDLLFCIGHDQTM